MGRGEKKKKKKRNNEKPNVRLKGWGQGLACCTFRGLRALNGGVGGTAKRGWWWRRLVVTFNFLGVGARQNKKKKSKNKKTKNEKNSNQA